MIRSRSVRASDGTVWRIRRHWAQRPRWRGAVRLWGQRRDKTKQPSSLVDWLEFPFRMLADGLDIADEGVGLVILGVLLLAVFVVFMIFVGVPLLLFLFETLLIVPVVVIVSAAFRVLFRRPWTIEGSDGSRRVEWKVVGWGGSSRAADRMAAEIASSGSPDQSPPAEPQAHRRHPR